MSQCIGRTKKALGCKQGHPMTMEHQRGGTYISNQENPKEMKRSTLQPGSLEFSTLAVRKHRVFKPHDQELAGSTEFSSPSSVIPSELRQVSPIFHTALHHIFSIWVGHPLQ